MKLFLFFLILSHANLVLETETINGMDYDLQCLNDFFYTISCSINIQADLNHSTEVSYWLQAQGLDELFECVVNVSKCELHKPATDPFTFTDVHQYQISLFTSLHGNNQSIILIPDYRPRLHSEHEFQPIPPVSLSVVQLEQQIVFSWLSGYEQQSSEFEEHTQLLVHLEYQLQLWTAHGVKNIRIAERNLSVSKSNFDPESEYAAVVRSQPNQKYYTGVWSQWAPTVHWRTVPNHNSSHLIGSVIICCMLLPFVAAVCILSRWMNKCRLPVPAPHITEWGEDIRHGIPAVLQGEELMKVDTLTAVPQADISENVVSNIGKGLKMNHSSLSSECDSGCWPSDIKTVEMESVYCSDEYCTLSLGPV
ncbi:interleukin-4 receptor subunit alpha isoform X2 [Denticeps clupeoides]|uniref:interleukin-4 receptor subunit alpha isoform X2 n=1 Tax=Denticeps clupeoides TaxID=299321 RepID=UPI0010A2FE96|nr:interleukin-4 receptor subunit alpha-like isoform X2 [Denticeps clupeoides]